MPHMEKAAAISLIKNQKNTEKEQPAETPDEADGTEEEPEPAEAEAFAADEDAEAEEESGDE